MDDSAQKQNQNQVQIQNKIQQPANPISAPQKEAEVGPVSDYIVPSETAPKIENEVAEAGVKEVVHAPSLTEEHFKTGMRHAAETTPVKTEPTGQVMLPMSQAQAEEKAKGKTDDGSTWLANFILRFLKKMRLNSSS